MFSFLPSIASWVAAAAGLATAVVVILRNNQSVMNWLFALGMALSAAESLLVGASLRASTWDDMLEWQRYGLLASSFLSGVWLLYSLAFARGNYREFLSRWKWVLAASLLATPLVVGLFCRALFTAVAATGDEESAHVLIRLGWPGYVAYLLLLVMSVAILMNLERAFRHATGHARWQIKFMILGLGALFGVRLYAHSQAVLFHQVDTNMEVVCSLALILACVMVARSLTRIRAVAFDLYLSHSVLHNSFTAIVVGAYFVLVAIVARLTYRLWGLDAFPLTAFFILLALVGLAAIFLSDKLRFRRKRFISRHFKRPVYDYQKVWAGFTENTASLTSIKDLCMAIATLVSHTLDTLSVSLWLVGETQDRPDLGWSTMLADTHGEPSLAVGDLWTTVVKLMSDRSLPIDLFADDDEPAARFRGLYEKALEAARVRYCVPLRAAGRLVGILALGERVLNQPLSFEDYELLRTIGDQSAATLLNLRLSERLRQAKELEAYQVMSAFFMHDLKNLASRLSLVSQNMPVHLDNPEFRQDALQTVSQSVQKIKGMCSRLSMLSQTLELNPRPIDLNDVVRFTLSGMNGQTGCTIETSLCDVLEVLADREQLQKVIENLLINASEATEGPGKINVSTTRTENTWAEFSVHDEGCGMSKEFMEQYLFKPFQTTKKHGMGIGLFHCKTIIEAHGGRIEVESEEGKGSTFKVLLPVRK
jgi:putative PEP-CTERM system histidine kinase